MNNFKIITDSGCDLTNEQIEEFGLSVVDLTVLVDGEEPKLNREVNVKELYSMLRNKKGAKTAASNINDFINVMEPILKDDTDIYYIGFSSALSSTYNSGEMAAKELSEKYPERKIFTTDSLCASLGQGLLIYYAVKMRNEGCDISSVHKFIEDNKLNLCHQFTVDDLFFLKRGGRVSAATAVMGTMLNIKPVLHVDNEGRLIKVGTARGRRASINALFDKMKTTAIDVESQVIYISHGDCLDDAQMLADRIKNELHVKEVFIGYVGPVIGAHSGPGTVALFYLGTER